MSSSKATDFSPCQDLDALGVTPQSVALSQSSLVGTEPTEVAGIHGTIGTILAGAGGWSELGWGWLVVYFKYFFIEDLNFGDF